MINLKWDFLTHYLFLNTKNANVAIHPIALNTTKTKLYTKANSTIVSYYPDYAA